jgi:hypothetical protein
MDRCQDCGRRAPTKYVEFYQNIGVLIMRFTRTVRGNLCRDCIDKHFWSLTGMTLILGWWGVVSFIITPFILLNNIARYIGVLRLARAPLWESTAENSNNQRAHEALTLLQTQLNAGRPVQAVANALIENGMAKEAAVLALYAATGGKLANCERCQLLFTGTLSFCPKCGGKLTPRVTKPA